MRAVGDEKKRLPADIVGLADGLGGELRRGETEKRVSAGSFQGRDLRINRRIGGFIGCFRDDHRRSLAPQLIPQRFEVVLAEVVVLIEHADFCVRAGLQQMADVARGAGLLAGQERHRPRKVFRIAPLHAGRGDEELRHFFRVQVFHCSRVWRRAEGTEQQQDLIGFDQLARLLDGLGRTVAVIERKQFDLAPVDPAPGIDHLEISGLGPADRAECG